MIPTIEFIQHKFNEFNRLFFASQLPPLPIRLSSSKAFLGKLSFSKRTSLFGTQEYYNFKIHINTRVDLPQEEIEDTLIHEMIHYYIHLNRIEDTSTHGVVFKRLMNQINQQGKRHISISHKPTLTEQQQLRGKAKPHIFALVDMADGKSYIKVVPRIERRIIGTHNNLLRTFHPTRIRWYYAVSNYLNAFPSSTAMRLYLYDDNELRHILEDAIHIICDGKTLKIDHTSSMHKNDEK